MTLLLTRSDVERVLDAATCIDAVENAFRARAAGARMESAILGLHGEAGGLHVKAASMLGDQAYFAAKLNANFPGNRAAGELPTIQGVLALFDARNGVPLAVMDSIGITLLRTAAASAVAARHLARAGPSRVTIVGCGAQALPQLTAIAAVRPIAALRTVDRDSAAAARLVEKARIELGIDATIATDLRAAARASDIIVTCTTSRAPFLGTDDVCPGTFVAAVGADNEEKSEIEPALMASAVVVVDHRGQCETIGDLHHAILAGAMRADDVRAELSDVVLDPARGRRRDDEIVIFDSTGVALEDVAAAAVVYERASSAGLGQHLAFGH